MYKILVVDDDFEILKLMTNIFEMQNYAVTTYQVVNSPIDIDDFMGFDLILLDDDAKCGWNGSLPRNSPSYCNTNYLC